jgi:hypothetical protein
MDAGHKGEWHIAQPAPKADPALEAAMRPFLQELTAKEREAVSVFFAEERPDERTAAATLGIHLRTFQERLYGREGSSIGALKKVRAAILAALDPDMRRRLEDEEDGAYADLRRWLTPAETIRADGTEDPWHDADCLVCNRPLAKWRQHSLASGLARYAEPRLICAIHLN